MLLAQFLVNYFLASPDNRSGVFLLRERLLKGEYYPLASGVACGINFLKRTKFCSWAGETRHIIQTESPKQHGRCAKCKRKLPQTMLNIIKVADNIERNLRKLLDIKKKAKHHISGTAMVHRSVALATALTSSPQFHKFRAVD